MIAGAAHRQDGQCRIACRPEVHATVRAAPSSADNGLFEAAGGGRAAPAIGVGLAVGLQRRQVGIKDGRGAIDRRVDGAEMRRRSSGPADSDGFRFVLVVSHVTFQDRAAAAFPSAQMISPADNSRSPRSSGRKRLGPCLSQKVPSQPCSKPPPRKLGRKMTAIISEAMRGGATLEIQRQADGREIDLAQRDQMTK